MIELKRLSLYQNLVVKTTGFQQRNTAEYAKRACFRASGANPIKSRVRETAGTTGLRLRPVTIAPARLRHLVLVVACQQQDLVAATAGDHVEVVKYVSTKDTQVRRGRIGGGPEMPTDSRPRGR